MNRFLLSLGILAAAQNANAQLSMLPYETTESYQCFAPNIGYGTKGVWLWYACDPIGNMPIGSPTKIIWMAQPYPVRLDLIGARFETIKNSEDKLKAANAAWKRFVTLPPDDPALLEVKKEMIEKDRVPIKQ